MADGRPQNDQFLTEHTDLYSSHSWRDASRLRRMAAGHPVHTNRRVASGLLAHVWGLRREGTNYRPAENALEQKTDVHSSRRRVLKRASAHKPRFPSATDDFTKAHEFSSRIKYYKPKFTAISGRNAPPEG